MNKKVFSSKTAVKTTNTVNAAGGRAYALGDRHALAQLAVTGVFNNTAYDSSENQLKQTIELCNKVAEEKDGFLFIAKAAMYARNASYMKDMPAFLTAFLASKAPQNEDAKRYLEAIFQHTIDNGKMLRNFCQIIRSGVLGRKSFGTFLKQLIRNWFTRQNNNTIFRASVGNDPSLADVIKMVHPVPTSKEQEALFGYIIGKKHNTAALPPLVQQYEHFKAGTTIEVPDVPFEMLTGLSITEDVWVNIAKQARWQMLRMNLNTFARHNVFAAEGMTKRLAEKLADREEIIRSRCFPYQLLIASRMAEANVPKEIREALIQAMEIAVENVPKFEGKVVVCVDVSGSMSSPVTGDRGSGTTSVRRMDVAALIAAAFVKANPDTEVLAFDDQLYTNVIGKNQTVRQMANKLCEFRGGGTEYNLPMEHLVKSGNTPDLVIYVSDMQGWIDNHRVAAGTQSNWEKLRKRNPKARAVHINVDPNTTSQTVNEDAKVMDIGGWSDRMWDVVARFLRGESANWVEEIEKTHI